jgi:hypothetical protein
MNGNIHSVEVAIYGQELSVRYYVCGLLAHKKVFNQDNGRYMPRSITEWLRSGEFHTDDSLRSLCDN